MKKAGALLLGYKRAPGPGDGSKQKAKAPRGPRIRSVATPLFPKHLEAPRYSGGVNQHAPPGRHAKPDEPSANSSHAAGATATPLGVLSILIVPLASP